VRWVMISTRLPFATAPDAMKEKITVLP